MNKTSDMDTTELKIQLAEAKKDAERYRWLCQQRIVPSPSLWDDGVGFSCKLDNLPRRGTTEKPSLDAAIDAAIAQEKK